MNGHTTSAMIQYEQFLGGESGFIYAFVDPKDHVFDARFSCSAYDTGDV
jgi:hypothetical protein